MTRDDNHAIQNARGWSETITSMVAALGADYDRFEELRDMAEDRDTIMDVDEAEELRELRAAATVDGDEFTSADKVRERIEESVLEIIVRDEWYTPGHREDAAPDEFAILLTTGGPALRIRGELDEHKEPRRAWLEYQDWGTPWTEFHGEGVASQDDLLTFCQCFYFGE